jgi:hypothetical protein
MKVVLAVTALKVRSNRRRGQAQEPCDLLVCSALTYQIENLGLASADAKMP